MCVCGGGNKTKQNKTKQQQQQQQQHDDENEVYSQYCHMLVLGMAFGLVIGFLEHL
jgi:hypothetical protein